MTAVVGERQELLTPQQMMQIASMDRAEPETDPIVLRVAAQVCNSWKYPRTVISADEGVSSYRGWRVNIMYPNITSSNSGPEVRFSSFDRVCIPT